MATLESRLSKLEAQHAGPPRMLVVRQDHDRTDLFHGGEMGSGDERHYTQAELDALGAEWTVLKIVYASLADVRGAQSGYLAADDLADLENKAAELVDFGPVKTYIGASPDDWDAPQN
jgi:hypothetical protein